MPDTTPVYGWPIPVLTDDPNIPADITAGLLAVEDTVNTVTTSNTTQGFPSVAVTINDSAWTTICSVTISPLADAQADIVAWTRMVNTGSTRPSIAIGVFDGTSLLFGIGEAHYGGTSDQFGEEFTINTPRRRVSLSAGSHTLSLQAWKNANGAVTAKVSSTLVGQIIQTSGIEVNY